ncbi:MAG TPA: hypothetical protein VMD30_02545 [Tepidisphaeraceae bacterium]|nr:hypothetical protein [Tepidisphaeraceae bacterium]
MALPLAVWCGLHLFNSLWLGAYGSWNNTPMNQSHIRLVLASLSLISIPVASLAQTTQPATTSSYKLVGKLVTGASLVQVESRTFESPLELSSSNQQLVDVFNWARAQACAYVFNGDPVGPWYEAVEPGREGFCIRDTCHQALGAQALGLTQYTHNMLHRFAEGVSDSKDWCSYWEINRYGLPAPVDYKNDAEFWYNLPANFDLVDCCFRMYVWSGDRSYVTDPVFLNLYDRTVNDYVTRWGLGIDQIMTRPRLLNVRGILDPTSKFQRNRGIPGYNEGDHNYIVSFDVLATQYAAYQAYANIAGVRGDEDQYDKFMTKAAALKNLIDSKWWDAANQRYYSRIGPDYKMEEGEGNDPRQTGLLDWDSVNYQDPDAATAKLLDLKGVRLEYPEVSFTRIGTIVSGTMGINVVFSNPLLASVKGDWVEAAVQTYPGLGSTIGWAEIRNLTIRDNLVTVRHEGMRKTTFTNQRGPALIWIPTFPGLHDTLLVNGQPQKATQGKDSYGRDVTSLRVAVGAGGRVTVEVAE